jgi:hypothetical protein
VEWFRTSRNAELVVIFGEDLAALLGLVIAFVAVLAAWITGNRFSTRSAASRSACCW